MLTLVIDDDSQDHIAIEIKSTMPDYQVTIAINRHLNHQYKRDNNLLSITNNTVVEYVKYYSNHESQNILVVEAKTAPTNQMKSFYLIINDTKTLMGIASLVDQLSTIEQIFSAEIIEPPQKGESKKVYTFKQSRYEIVNAINISVNMSDPETILETIINEFKASQGNITFLVGAGLSAESGIPTFRGVEGFWTVGSKNYTPEEICTLRMFKQHPEEVWNWYIERLLKYNQSSPNHGHYALVEFEKAFGDRFSLITQNVDGLTYKAGSSSKRSFPIHGSINYTRCSKECSKEVFLAPEELAQTYQQFKMGQQTINLLKCPKCGAMLRPHILWFDECYNEEYYKYDTVHHKASKTDLLIVVGTTGATNLPYQVVSLVNYNNKPIININPNPNEMNDYLRRASDVIIRKKSSTALMELLNSIAPSAGLEPATL